MAGWIKSSRTHRRTRLPGVGDPDAAALQASRDGPTDLAVFKRLGDHRPTPVGDDRRTVLHRSEAASRRSALSGAAAIHARIRDRAWLAKVSQETRNAEQAQRQQKVRQQRSLALRNAIDELVRWKPPLRVTFPRLAQFTTSQVRAVVRTSTHYPTASRRRTRPRYAGCSPPSRDKCLPTTNHSRRAAGRHAQNSPRLATYCA
jgi:hypothetical protein